MSEDTTDRPVVAAQASDQEASPDMPAALSSDGADPTSLDEELLRLYVGPNADRFASVYQAQLEKKSTLSFNWPAFFAPLPWLFYRKLYLAGAGVMLLPVLLVVIFPSLASINLSGLGVALAIMSSPAYVRYALRRIDRIKSLNLPEEEFEERVKEAGGTSPAGAVFGSLIMISAVGLMIVGMMGSKLPECDNPRVQGLAKKILTEGLVKKGFGAETLVLGDFATVVSGTSESRNMCSFSVQNEDVSVVRYLAVTWQEEETGKFQVRVGPNQAALMD